MEFILDPAQWAEEQFGTCVLGDQRRTRRTVKFAAQVAAHPDGSTPQQTHSWGDCRAAYRLLDANGVTFATLAEPHWHSTRRQATGHCLLLGDTTELNFGWNRQAAGLGPTGKGTGCGFMLHSSLVVASDSEGIIGLAGQEIFHRQPAPKGESRYARSQRPRESEVWGRVIRQVGPPAEGVRWTHVFDRGADNFEVYCALLQNRCDWVIRGSQLKRRVQVSTGETQPLENYLACLPVIGTYTLPLRTTAGQKARTATLEVRIGLITMPAPKHLTPALRAWGISAFTQWVVEAREVGARRGTTPMRWVLYTSHAVGSFEEARRVLGYYERRWTIEEFHKALKTGCRVEERQYETSKRLEAVTGLLSVLAVRLLQLKAVARSEPERSAAEVVPPIWLHALRRLCPKVPASCTIRTFYRRLAGLGGHLGRKHDGEPGWITLWRGLDQLILAVRVLEPDEKCG